MDKIQPYIDEYKVSLIGGGVAVGLGFLGKKLMKKDLLPVAGVRKIGESFLLVTLSGIAAQEIKKKMDTTK